MNGHECYIISAGDFYGLQQQPDDSDYVIAADAGFNHCREHNIIPDLLIGDFDSLGDCPEHPNIIRLPKEKDDTDTLFALKTGLERGYRRFYLYGCTGGDREDHTVANLQALLYMANHGARAWMFGKNCVWTAIKNSSLGIKGSGRVAVFSADGTARGVSLKGLKYELSDAEISSDYPLGVSNEMASEEAELSVTDGALLIMYEISIEEI